MPLPLLVFCAELVASILKVGGLLDANCNPGSATPEMLHRIYAQRGAASANPCILRELNGGNAASASTFIGNLTPAERNSEREALLPVPRSAPVSRHGPLALPAAPPQPIFQGATARVQPAARALPRRQPRAGAHGRLLLAVRHQRRHPADDGFAQVWQWGPL